MIFCTRNLQKRVQLVETENAKLSQALSNAVGSWTDDKQMTGKLHILGISLSSYDYPIPPR